jgi:hypothetical protein
MTTHTEDFIVRNATAKEDEALAEAEEADLVEVKETDTNIQIKQPPFRGLFFVPRKI